MTAEAGVLRREDGLGRTARSLQGLFAGPAADPGTEAWETTNLATLGIALAGAAQLRRETRGSHWRDDHPDRDDDAWTGHVDVRLEGGLPAFAFRPSAGVPAADLAEVGA